MNILFFDIETVPTEASLAEKESLKSKLQLEEAEIIKKLSLSATSARILCLAYAIEPPADSAVEVLHGEERQILEKFWSLADTAHLFVGHNIFDFDVRFIYQRSMIQQIKPSRQISFKRFRSAPVYDTMQEWTRWGRDTISLDSLSRALGLESPKESLDGAKVYPYYCEGKLAEICEYCRRDVEAVRRVYRRMTFTGEFL
jgi:predicted PolB exonuclease-like 3'-5' exonuclease